MPSFLFCVGGFFWPPAWLGWLALLLLARCPRMHRTGCCCFGTCADFAVTVDDVPALMLSTVTVTLQPEGIKGRVGEAITAMTVDDASFAPPITLLVVLMVVLFGLLAFRAYRRYSTAAAGSGASYDDEPQPEREHEPA